MVKMLPEPRDLFKDGVLSPFIVKVGRDNNHNHKNCWFSLLFFVP
jgi:hypothetical protein